MKNIFSCEYVLYVEPVIIIFLICKILQNTIVKFILVFMGGIRTFRKTAKCQDSHANQTIIFVL